MIRVSFGVTEEQARAIIESIDSLDDGEEWEPELSFNHRNAQEIRTKLHWQLQAREQR